MASRNQAAIGPDDKLLLVIVGVALAGLFVTGLVFAIANGFASGVAGFLYNAGLPKAMALDVYKMVRWGTVGGLFVVGLVGVVSVLRWMMK